MARAWDHVDDGVSGGLPGDGDVPRHARASIQAYSMSFLEAGGCLYPDACMSTIVSSSAVVSCETWAVPTAGGGRLCPGACPGACMNMNINSSRM